MNKETLDQINEAKKLKTETIWDFYRRVWVCKLCNNPHERLYVATGHDHTDYEIDFCECRKHEK